MAYSGRQFKARTKLLTPMNYLLYILLMAIVITSCGPARNSKGEYWKGYQVWKRVIAGNYHKEKPRQNQLPGPNPIKFR